MAGAIDNQLKQGALELAALALLAQNDGAAYGIARRLAESIGVEEGAVYPLMRRLQNDGLVETHEAVSPAGPPPRKHYRLTEGGRACLASQKAAWTALSRAMHDLFGEAP